MAGPQDPRPYRLSDAERDDALARLRTAFEEGRLDIDEHEARASLAVRAVTSSDLVPLFGDLPATDTRAPGAGRGSTPVPEPHRKDRGTAPACADSGDRSAPWWGVLPWVGCVFLFWGLPAVLDGSREALVGWGIFLTVMIVPHVVVGVVRHSRRPT